MRAVVVAAPDETRWNVRVVWAPRWPVLARRFGGWRARRKKARKDAGDGPEMAAEAVDLGTDLSSGGGGGGDWDFGDFTLVIMVLCGAFIAAAALFWWVLLPLLLIVLDAVIVVTLLVLSVLGRVLIRRPWTVQAAADGHPPVTVEVVGWRAALRRRDELADALRHGHHRAAQSQPA